jgi:hypothetical protein
MPALCLKLAFFLSNGLDTRELCNHLHGGVSTLTRMIQIVIL